MQIQLCEDDGLFHEDGIPTMVVIVVKFDNGKTRRIPYPADKPIASLYQDLNAIADKIVELNLTPPEEISLSDFEEKPIAEKLKKIQSPLSSKKFIDKSNIIEKEDIVTMVKMHERDKGATNLLMIGMNYRVIEIIGPRHPVTQEKIVQGYDVVDDTAAGGLERLFVYPDEVVLKSKRLSEIIPKVHKVEEILACPSCQAKNSLILEGEEFKGTCEACQQEIVIARIIKDCQTPTCRKEKIKVSCFDVGDKYEGICGTCGDKIEVPYA